MSAESPALIRSFKVGKRICTLTIARPRAGKLAHSTAEWQPDVPRRLTSKEMDDYRRGRDAAFAEFAAEAGLRVLLVE